MIIFTCHVSCLAESDLFLGNFCSFIDGNFDSSFEILASNATCVHFFLQSKTGLFSSNGSWGPSKMVICVIFGTITEFCWKREQKFLICVVAVCILGIHNFVLYQLVQRSDLFWTAEDKCNYRFGYFSEKLPSVLQTLSSGVISSLIAQNGLERSTKTLRHVWNNSLILRDPQLAIRAKIVGSLWQITNAQFCMLYQLVRKSVCSLKRRVWFEQKCV